MMDDFKSITKAAVVAAQKEMALLFGEVLGTYKLSNEVFVSGGQPDLYAFEIHYFSEEFKKLLFVTWIPKTKHLELTFADDDDDMSNEFTVYPNSLEDAKDLIIRHNKGWGKC